MFFYEIYVIVYISFAFNALHTYVLCIPEPEVNDKKISVNWEGVLSPCFAEKVCDYFTT